MIQADYASGNVASGRVVIGTYKWPYTGVSVQDSGYTTSGDYTYSHSDANGCEQVDTLHLTIYNSSTGEFSEVACESYQWNDSVYTSSGDYVQHFTDVHGTECRRRSG